MEQVKIEYNRAKRRLLLLDYDGVLVPLAPTPEAAAPSASLVELLRALANDPRNTVVVISGRPPETLDEWLGQTGVDFAAEHGHFIKKQGDWRQVATGKRAWKKTVRQHMAEAVRQVPGSHIEEKHTSLVWHYRQASPAPAERMAHTLLATLSRLDDLHVSLGAKVVEARLPGADKGQAAHEWLRPEYDFVLAAGDDTTDEDLFTAMPPGAITVKIGPGATVANVRLASSKQFVQILMDLIKS